MVFFANSRREWALIGVLIGVVVTAGLVVVLKAL